jgi:hypothetical protein
MCLRSDRPISVELVNLYCGERPHRFDHNVDREFASICRAVEEHRATARRARGTFRQRTASSGAQSPAPSPTQPRAWVREACNARSVLRKPSAKRLAPPSTTASRSGFRACGPDDVRRRWHSRSWLRGCLDASTAPGRFAVTSFTSRSRHLPVALTEGSLTRKVNKTGVRLWT